MSSIEPGLNIQFNNMTANIYQGFCNICIHVHTQLRSLTNEESRKNWETYGNPDGPRGEDHNLLEINITSLLFIIIIIIIFLSVFVFLISDKFWNCSSCMDCRPEEFHAGNFFQLVE